jgi:hypothetical protein
VREDNESAVLNICPPPSRYEPSISIMAAGRFGYIKRILKITKLFKGANKKE